MISDFQYATSNQLNGQLPDDLKANIEENLTVYKDEDKSAICPDVHVSHDPTFRSSHENISSAVVTEPLVLRRAPHPTRHVEIVDKDGRIITAIEFLSPWNNVGNRAREQYTRKQLDYIDAGVNLVQIDLVRQGSYVLAAPLEVLRPEERTPYLIRVYRDSHSDQFEMYRATFEQALPNVPVPLRHGEPDAVLQLQALINQCYEDGRYYRLDYSGKPYGKSNKQSTCDVD